MERVVTVYGEADRHLATHYRVTRVALPMNGHLLVTDEDGVTGYASGRWWSFTDETHPTRSEYDTAEALATPDGPVPTLPVPTVPGPAEPERPTQVLSVAGLLTDGGRVHEAMQIHCVCNELRCPVVLNQSTPEERRWWQIRQRGEAATGKAPEPEALQRCSHETGHEPLVVMGIDGARVVPHAWVEEGWPYGPANHHPACPRHPESYNRAALDTSEGQPRHAAGVTEADEPEAEAEADPRERGELIRPYVASVGRVITPDDHGALYERAGNSGPGQPLPDRLPYNRGARDSWHTCAQYAPGYNGQAWCGLPSGHVGPGHSVTLPGGDRVTW
jgi:hypothetical protein